LHAELVASGMHVSRKRVVRLMREEGAAEAPVGKIAPLAGGFVWNDPNAIVARTTGRVFFTLPNGGGDGACSGSAINSENKSVVFTAARCIYSRDKRDGIGWMYNVMFVPGYSSQGQRKKKLTPYGIFTARINVVTAQWAEFGDRNFDYAAFVVNANINTGKTLVDTVGGQGFAVNQPIWQTISTFGYPAGMSNPAYNGKQLIVCNGNEFVPYPAPFFLLAVGCDMDAGASGGPWLAGFDGQLGYVKSVVSESSLKLPAFRFVTGPYFGNTALSLFNDVRFLQP
jgi:hypothetical protein